MNDHPNAGGAEKAPDREPPAAFVQYLFFPRHPSEPFHRDGLSLPTRVRRPVSRSELAALPDYLRQMIGAAGFVRPTGLSEPPVIDFGLIDPPDAQPPKTLEELARHQIRDRVDAFLERASSMQTLAALQREEPVDPHWERRHAYLLPLFVAHCQGPEAEALRKQLFQWATSYLKAGGEAAARLAAGILKAGGRKIPRRKRTPASKGG